MELSELIVEYRRRAADNVGEYHVSDAELARFATEAEKEACARAQLLYDDSTFVIAVTANQADIELDPLVDRVIGGTFTPTGTTTVCDLDMTGMDWIRERIDWQTISSSRPWKLAQKRDKLRMYPLPSVAGTLLLEVYRFPFNAIEDTSDEPEIPVQHHDGLVDWMLYRAYSTKDAELEDPKRAAEALALFEARFGFRPDADTSRRQNERRRITTRPI